MAKVIFYEKPGCANNTRQKGLLKASGHDVEARNLLTETWTPELLRSFFGARPVAEWFNRAAPRVKSGAVQPEAVSADAALEMMLAEPLLIRRPLIQVGERREAGFDADMIDGWIGLQPTETPVVEGCPRVGHPGEDKCPSPGDDS